MKTESTEKFRILPEGVFQCCQLIHPLSDSVIPSPVPFPLAPLGEDWNREGAKSAKFNQNVKILKNLCVLRAFAVQSHWQHCTFPSHRGDD